MQNHLLIVICESRSQSLTGNAELPGVRGNIFDGRQSLIAGIPSRSLGTRESLQTKAFNKACNLSCTSANSLSGSEPATIPAPAYSLA